MELATEKRREKLLKLIKERQKNEAMYMAKYVEQQLKDDLLKLPFLTEEKVNNIMSVILTMSYEQKKDIVPAVKILKKNLMIWPNKV